MKLTRFRSILLCFALIPAPLYAGSAPVRIVIMGDSLTAGYQIEPNQAFPSLLKDKAEQKGHSISVVNAGISGDTTAGGLRRLDWLLRQPFDIFVLALGANDGLRGLPLPQTEANLTAILQQVRQAQPGAQLVLAGMQIPANMGREYTEAFAAMFPRIAEKTGASLIPFLLEGVALRPEFNLPDRIHPNPAGHQVMAATVWKTLEPLLSPSPTDAKQNEESASRREANIPIVPTP
jgi:acyl-CoA thioesterase-1